MHKHADELQFAGTPASVSGHGLVGSGKVMAEIPARVSNCGVPLKLMMKRKYAAALVATQPSELPADEDDTSADRGGL